MGSVYKRGEYWWIKFKDQHGDYQYETKKWKIKREASTQLSIREAQVSKREYQGKQIDTVKYEDIAILLIEDYQVNKKKSLHHTQKRIDRLSKYFKGTKVIDIPSHIKPFIKNCQENGFSNAYINRFLSALRRMFTLGYRHIPKLVAEIPHIDKLDENNVRKGFFEHDEYQRLHALLPHYLRLPLTIGYLSGVREGETFSIKLEDVNFITGAIRFPETKNGDPRVIYLTGKYYEDLLAQKAEIDEKYPSCQYLIHREGSQIKSFREAWKTACKRSGVPGRLYHDLRRTAARNMLAAGVPEKQIMQIGGWKTRSIFDRYNIVNENDLKRASDSVVRFLIEKEVEAARHKDREGKL